MSAISTFYSSYTLRPDWTPGRFTASTTETKSSFNIREDFMEDADLFNQRCVFSELLYGPLGDVGARSVVCGDSPPAPTAKLPHDSSACCSERDSSIIEVFAWRVSRRLVGPLGSPGEMKENTLAQISAPSHDIRASPARGTTGPPLSSTSQKPWVNGEVRAKLKARTDAYNSGDLEEYRKSRYAALRRAIISAKRQYRDKVESHYKGSNTRSMWAGLKTLTDYKKKISSAEVMSASLPDELNTFYARFESTSPAVEVQKAQEDHCPPVISRADVCRTLKRINTRKAPGPDGIPGRALKVPTCFKETTIVPVPKKTKILSLNDYRPVALTSTIMKCFERSNTIIKFADDTTVIGLITGDDEDGLQRGAALLPLQAAEAQHGLQDPLQLLQVHHSTIESILTGCITAWYSSCTTLNRKALQREVKAAQHITRTELPSMEDLYTQRCRKKATKIIKDPSHPSHPATNKLFCLLPSGRRLSPSIHPSIFICLIRDRVAGGGSSLSRDAQTSLTPETLPPSLPGGPRGVPRPAERHSLSSMSWVFLEASSRWDMPGTPP
ncbi:hypothetical protein L3Q82_020243 [Scortum barcoo]|uniref:Uncharacterized protein n=1 Tax=Scortum barcoo TaxID=214431 RepID=A0ACB8VBF4_9TELE|nr:hypothetical protein L3Q82_020243 [Scortum barcoo]